MPDHRKPGSKKNRPNKRNPAKAEEKGESLVSERLLGVEGQPQGEEETADHQNARFGEAPAEPITEGRCNPIVSKEESLHSRSRICYAGTRIFLTTSST